MCANSISRYFTLTLRVYLIYLPIRLYGLASASPEISDFALSVLSCESALLFPRLAFTIMKKNVLVMYVSPSCRWVRLMQIGHYGPCCLNSVC